MGIEVSGNIMKNDEKVFRLVETDKFFAFCAERHHIWMERSRGKPFPWTDDPILQKFKFTNIYRELDRGTIFLREHVIEPYPKHCELFFNIAIYRRYNHYPTFESVGYVFNYVGHEKEQIIANIRGRIRDHKAVYTSAHMLCGMLYKDGKVIPDRTDQIWDYAFGMLWDKRREIEPKEGDTLRDAFERCMDARIPAFGPFIWYEVITDLRHTRYLQNAADILSWANPGPGAARGLARITNTFKKGVAVHIPREVQIDLMQMLLTLSSTKLPYWMPEMEMRDIEHSLCEFDKWMRIKNHEGKTRMVFVPPELRKK